MSLYDFFFPQQAAAEHLRAMAEHHNFSNTLERVNRARNERKRIHTEKRIEELEDEVAQLTIVLDALLEVLSKNEAVSSEAVARKIVEIDARDGVVDGRITKKEEPKSKDTDGLERPELLFPD